MLTFAIMSVGKVTREQLWDTLKSGGEFSIQFVTCDIVRKKGGKRIHLKKAVTAGTSSNSTKNRVVGIKSAASNSHHPYQVNISLIEFINDQRVL